MAETKPQTNEPMKQKGGPFIVKVKLLSNQTYDIETRPEILVGDLKKIIEEKVKVPIDRQKIIFMGKQMENHLTLKEYVKQSGLTIHLIARLLPPNQQLLQPQPQPQPQQNQQPGVNPMFNAIPNLGNLFGSMSGATGNTNANQSIGQGLNQFFGMPNMPNIEIRMNGLNAFGRNPQNPQGNNQPQPNQPINPQNQQNNPQTPPQPNPQVPPPQPNPQNQQTNPQGQPQQGHFTTNYNPLTQLQANVSRVSLPHQTVPHHMNPRDQTLLYLRKLQSEYLRFMPQLSRSIQLLQQGRITHINDLLPIFRSINTANTGAIDVIQKYVELHQRMQQHHHHQHHQHQGNNNQNQVQPPIVPQPQPQQQQEVVIKFGPQNGVQIQGNARQHINMGQFMAGFNGALNNPRVPPNNPVLPNQNNNPQPNPQPANGGELPGSNSGFNFANLFASRPQVNPTQPNQNNIPQPVQPNPPQPIPPQMTQSARRADIPTPPPPINAAQLFQSLSAPVVRPPNNQQGQQGSQQPAQPMNYMQMFNSFLGQSGGMGNLLGMSLGDMFEQGQGDPIYINIFKVLSGTEMIGIFTQKNFSFLNTKRQQTKQAFNRSIQIAGSREQLIVRYSQDMTKLLTPSAQTKNKEQWSKRLEKIVSTHIQKIVGLFLDAPAETNLEIEVCTRMKLLFCQSVEELSKHMESMDAVFKHIKDNSIQLLDKYAPGLSGLFYGIVERDLIRIYKEYVEEQDRKRAMSEEEVKDQSELIKQIQIEAGRDVELMATFEHSKYYPKE